MFLKEIESRPAEGMTAFAFARLRAAGQAIPGILHLFRFKRRSTNHLVRFTEEVMRGPSPLSPGMRELLGAYFSKRNQYSFCSDAHAAAAAEFLDPALVASVLGDLERSPLDEAHKALFRYVGKLADTPGDVTASDVEGLKQVGWSEEAIFDALTIAAMFKFYNTWNAGAGVKTMTPSDYAHSGRVLHMLGYCMDFKVRRLPGIGVRTLRALLRRRPADATQCSRASASEPA